MCHLVSKGAGGGLRMRQFALIKQYYRWSKLMKVTTILVVIITKVNLISLPLSYSYLVASTSLSFNLAELRRLVGPEVSYLN